MLFWANMEMFLNDSGFCLDSIIRCCKSNTRTATEAANPLAEELRKELTMTWDASYKERHTLKQLICSTISGKKSRKLFPCILI